MSVQPVKWQQPKAARDLEWRQSTAQAKLVLVGWLMGASVIGLTAVRIVHHGDPRMLHAMITRVLSIGLGFPCIVFLGAWLESRIGTRYVLAENGLTAWRGGGANRFAWDSVEWYSITNYRELDGMRVLELKVGRSRKPKRWSFDPSRVDESEIREMCERYLPGRQSSGGQ
jgi:hypothetical protein